jgi:NADPH:quinone reductase-like Zn-dependent oxidoreductase
MPMRAMVTTALGGPEVIKLQEVPKPKCGPGDLLVEVHASAVNPVDTKLRRFGRAGLATPPFIGGYDVSGVVRAVGDHVSGYAPGDEVWASPALNRNGAHAEFVCVDHRTAARKPRFLSHAEAAGFPLVALTAWECLHRRAKVRSGQTVLVTAGGGGVGHVAIQLAKLAGCEVYATASSDESIELAKESGADVVINYKREDFVEAVLHETNSRGVEVIVECVGGETFEKCPDAVAVEGCIVPIVPGPIPQTLAKCFPKNASVHFEFMGAATVANAGPERQGEILREVSKLVDEGRLRVKVYREYPLEKLAEAHAQQETGRTSGKLVIRVK